jgi:hypothetical protein
LLSVGGTLSSVWTDPVSGGTLWVGGQSFTREQIETAAITTVISVDQPPRWLSGASEIERHVALFDDEEALPDMRLERDALAAARAALDAGRNVLIHCVAGRNRSCYLAGRLMIASGMTPVDAVRALLSRRDHDVLRNRTFARALLDGAPMPVVSRRRAPRTKRPSH